jgi:spermidine synthase
MLLGGIFPILATAAVRDVTELGKNGARLYAINTVGAALGSALGALWLPDWIGVQATYAMAILVSLVAAVMAVTLERAGRVGSVDDASTTSVPYESTIFTAPPRGMRAVAFASGFGSLALEVLLIHAIAQPLEFSVYSFGAVMVVVLLCLAVGAQRISLTTRLMSATRLLSASLLGVALLLWLLPAHLEHYQGVTDAGGLARGLHAAPVLGGPPLLMGSLVLPLLFRLAEASSGGVGRQVGSLLAINTAGGILGSLVLSFVLLQQFGLGASIALLGVGYGGASLVIASGFRGRLFQGAALGACFALVLASPLDPLSQPRVQLVEGEHLVDLREGPYGVVSVIDRHDVRRMKTDYHYTLSGSGPRGPVKERAGHIPLLLQGDPERVL